MKVSLIIARLLLVMFKNKAHVVVKLRKIIANFTNITKLNFYRKLFFIKALIQYFYFMYQPIPKSLKLLSYFHLTLCFFMK